MKIGVTGASGFIGRRIVEMGLEKGHEMVAFIRNPNKFGNELLGKVKVFKGDIAVKEDTKAFVEYCDVIIHTAATVTDWAPKEEYQKSSIDGTQYILDHLVGTKKKMVLASSIAVYGRDLEKNCTEDMPLREPVGNYSWAKQEQEKLTIKYGKEQGVIYSIIRPGNIFGPKSPSWVHEYIATMKKGPILIGGGKQQSLTYIDNVSEMFLLAAVKSSANSQIYNGVDDQEISWIEYATAISKTLNLKKPSGIGLGLGLNLGKMMAGVYSLLSIKTRPSLTYEAVCFMALPNNISYEKAKKELGFTPVVGRDEALKETLAYISKNANEF
jgi:nucleoside-diphosphate-sugar epimerase